MPSYAVGYFVCVFFFISANWLEKTELLSFPFAK